MLNVGHLRKYFTFLAGMTMLAGMTGCFDHHHDEDPTVEILEPADKSTVTGPKVRLRIKTENFTGHPHEALTAPSAHASGGHIHVFLDKPVGTDAEADTSFSDADTVSLVNVTPGTHYVIVQGANEKHKPYASMKDSISFTVK